MGEKQEVCQCRVQLPVGPRPCFMLLCFLPNAAGVEGPPGRVVWALCKEVLLGILPGGLVALCGLNRPS